MSLNMIFFVRIVVLLITLLTVKCEIEIRKHSTIEDTLTVSNLPDKFVHFVNHAKIARQLVHKANWSAVGSLSTDNIIYGYPMVNLISVADSAKGAPSTGHIYFLLTDLDFTAKDWQKENKVSFFFSQEQGGGCSKNNVDPMEPTCPRVLISGKVIKLKENSVEYPFAINAFISRHPIADKWTRAHKFYMCKLDITNIYVFDWYGGPKALSLDDYYRSDPDFV